MSLLSLLTDPATVARPHQHQHAWIRAINPLVESDEEDDFFPIWRVPRRARRMISSPYYGHYRHSKPLTKSGILSKIDKDQFQVNVDVQQFTPDEITVKATGNNTITVEGKHEEKPDEHGSIYRHFVRRYVLPKGHDIERVQSKLSSDGVLTITAPKIGKSKTEEREIEVVQTNKPSIPAPESTENGAGDAKKRESK